jgi:two-component system alkaline phosphatase synthesis response regulator PhoP
MVQGNKKRVLVADDESGVRRLVRRILSQEYDVIEAQDGEEAVRMARSQTPDIILMDIIMPKTDGLTACLAIKKDQNTKDIPVIMVTAIGYDLNKKLAENVAGASAYITKPFDSQEVLRTVGRLISNNKQIPNIVGSSSPNMGEELKM